MHNFYFACITENANGKHFAFPLTVSQSDNVVAVFGRYKGLAAANLFPTKREAKETADCWNESFKNNGTFLYNKNAGDAEPPYTLSYTSRYGYSFEFSRSLQNRIRKTLKDNPESEDEWGDIFDRADVEDYGTDTVDFENWVGGCEEDEYCEGDTFKFPAEARRAANEITAQVYAWLERNEAKEAQ